MQVKGFSGSVGTVLDSRQQANSPLTAAGSGAAEQGQQRSVERSVNRIHELDADNPPQRNLRRGTFLDISV